ncbi:MAG TPA: hypothetical protein EYN96_12860 [Candidatus Hydrogenedentes bacterium]|nr:hypothetical protein [Candidatus Hydrogenedentota bacterium]
MTYEMMLPLVMRWIHIFCAVVVVGSILFYRFAVLPASKQAFEDGMPDAFRLALMKKWKLLLHPPIILFLASGMYTYMTVTSKLHEDQGLYHALFGLKFLLALFVFALYIVLTSTMKWSEGIRDKNILWVLLVLSVTVIVGIAGVMKTLPVAVL